MNVFIIQIKIVKIIIYKFLSKYKISNMKDIKYKYKKKKF